MPAASSVSNQRRVAGCSERPAAVYRCLLRHAVHRLNRAELAWAPGRSAEVGLRSASACAAVNCSGARSDIDLDVARCKRSRRFSAGPAVQRTSVRAGRGGQAWMSPSMPLRNIEAARAKMITAAMIRA